MQADSATAGPQGVVVVHAQPAHLVCGGADDSHYDVAPGTTDLQLPPGARVTVVTTGDAGITTRQIAPGALGAWLQHDQFGEVFLVTTDGARVSALDEQYHP